MAPLAKTPLTASQKVDLAAAALAQEGDKGAITELSRKYGISRPSVYSARQHAHHSLREAFDTSSSGGVLARVDIDQDQLLRTLVALRVQLKGSIEDLRELLPILYPTLYLCHGNIHGLLAEAERRAAEFNARADLSGISNAALDELFSQRRPVLAGICLDTGYVFALASEPHRGADDWARVLRAGQQQGLDLRCVVKDAAQGIAAGVRQVFPNADQRDDSFHAHREISKVLTRLERRADAAIAADEQAEKDRDAARRSGQGLREASQRLRRARERCARVLSEYDSFEQAALLAREGMELVDVKEMRLRSPVEMGNKILEGARRMREHRRQDCRKVGRYIRNRAPGLVLHAREALAKLNSLGQDYGFEALRFASVLWQLHHVPSWYQKVMSREERKTRESVAELCLWQQGRGSVGEVTEAVAGVLSHRNRASSAIEGFNAAVRPHIYVHKGAGQGFNELFRAYQNLKTARGGLFKGTSAHERLTGERVEDWLSKLGYPPSPRKA